jgi:hypothetical protein
VLVLASSQAARPQAAQIPDNFVSGDHPAIRYAAGPLDDPATRLQRRLDSGDLKLERQKDSFGYLPVLLKALGISPDSQTLVFSKTSFQATRISPRNPRAIYFTDQATVGYVRGSDTLEVTTVDPKQGVIFYTFDNNTDTPRFDRRDVCMQCHHSPGTLGVPGLMIASVYPDGDGMPAFRGAQALTDHRTPFDERWGGWYVTGTHGEMRHRGNSVGHDRLHPDVLDTRDSQNLTALSRRFDQTDYLQTTSDIVALLVHEHQIRLINYLTRVGWEQRQLEYEAAKTPSAGHKDTALQHQLDADIEELAAYMLFAEEAQLRSKVTGVSTFSQTFANRGPKDSKGRSLRDFNLETRLFAYPLSYLIYSEQFDSLPSAAKERVYRRLWEVLSGADQSKRFERIPAASRLAALEILRETKKNLPAYFQER